MLEKIQSILYDQLNISADLIVPAASFKNDLGIDSLDLLELVTNVEEEYSIDIPAEMLEKIVTVGDFIDYLKNEGIEV